MEKRRKGEKEHGERKKRAPWEEIVVINDNNRIIETDKIR